MTHYIGRKGYSIQKESFTQSELHEFRTTLTVKPNMGGGGFVSNIQYPIVILFVEIF